MSVREQNRPHVAGLEAQVAQGTEDVVALARVACVDQGHPAVVADQGPVHQIGLGEVNVEVNILGDRAQGCRHEASVGRVEK